MSTGPVEPHDLEDSEPVYTNTHTPKLIRHQTDFKPHTYNGKKKCYKVTKSSTSHNLILSYYTKN